jgi:hypothetical protein
MAALSLETIRSAIMTSIRGRRLGLDKDECIAGPKHVKRPITGATSDTTGTALPNNGYVSVVSTTDDSWTLTAPYHGAEVTLMTGSSSTGIHTVTCAAGSVIYSTNGIAGANVVLTGHGAAMSLLGISTAIWQVTSMSGSTPSNYVSS